MISVFLIRVHHKYKYCTCQADLQLQVVEEVGDLLEEFRKGDAKLSVLLYNLWHHRTKKSTRRGYLLQKETQFLT